MIDFAGDTTVIIIVVGIVLVIPLLILAFLPLKIIKKANEKMINRALPVLDRFAEALKNEGYRSETGRNYAYYKKNRCHGKINANGLIVEIGITRLNTVS